MDPFERGETANLSMREKSTLKRRINREHNSNFRAGYININEPYLHKTGIRGRKRYFLYCIVTFLILLACANALLTAGIMYALKFSYFGIQSMEFIPESRLLRFLSDTTFSTVQIFDGFLGGRFNSTMVIQSNGSVVFKADTDGGTDDLTIKVGIHRDGTEMTSVDDFKVTSPDTGKVLLSTGLHAQQEWTSVLKQGVNIHAPVVETPVLESVWGIDGLSIESFVYTEVKGMEGLELSSDGNIYFIANNITLQSTDGSITLDAAHGVYLDSNLPKTMSPPSTLGPDAYKLCVCMPSGKVFAMQVTGPGLGCGHADPSNDPCA